MSSVHLNWLCTDCIPCQWQSEAHWNRRWTPFACFHGQEGKHSKQHSGLTLDRLVKKYREIQLETNSKATYSKLRAETTSKGSPWKMYSTFAFLDSCLRAFFIPPVYASSFPKATLATVLDVLVNANASLFVVVLSVPIFLSCQLSLSNKAILTFLDSQTSLTLSALGPNERAKFANFSTWQKKMMSGNLLSEEKFNQRTQTKNHSPRHLKSNDWVWFNCYDLCLS